MFKLARKNYLREIFSGGSSCTGDCGQGRRCTCNPDREESAGKFSNCESKLPIGKTMTREEIIRMAREAGLPEAIIEMTPAAFERFAALIAAHEREECAKIAETPFSGEQDDITMQAKDRVAAAIRARGNK